MALKVPLVVVFGLLAANTMLRAEPLELELRSQYRTNGEAGEYVRSVERVRWEAGQTAVIVCDVWDKHHCLNAVRRLEEFAPRMNQVLNEARRRGATIIHAPSDCMPAYEKHPARQRAAELASAEQPPVDVEFWCSKIPSEERAVYPIDQSDGGVDDDPAEHQRWAAELKAQGRNPELPWKAQSPLIEIDEQHDFISDRGDEVWNILQARSIENVILVGVHTNMCVLGRPFGLRQMVRSGKAVALMRDMTDCMYNPQRWPYVDHFTGNDLVISHVERYVCPTITSDQLLGGQPFVSKYDRRELREIMSLAAPSPTADSFRSHWTTSRAGATWNDATGGVLQRRGGIVWLRCSVRLPARWLTADKLELHSSPDNGPLAAWLNGTKLDETGTAGRLSIPAAAVSVDDINLLVVRITTPESAECLPKGLSIVNGQRSLSLEGRWQFRFGDDPSWSNVPLPAKFALGPDVLFEAP